MGELAASNTTGAVGSAHLTPHHTEPGAVLLGLGAVHVHDTLAEVKFQVSSGVDTLDFDQAGVVLLLGQSPVANRGLGTRNRTATVSPTSRNVGYFSMSTPTCALNHCIQTTRRTGTSCIQPRRP